MTDDLRLTLLGTASAAGLVRTLAAQRIRRWGCARILDDVLLVASELIVNACEATPNDDIRFLLGREEGGVYVAVWDGGPALPRARPVREMSFEALDASEGSWDSGGGWGLPIVAALSASCGVRADPAGGKWVWAACRATTG
uniref:Histidine kinase/HSP90-like ATPase domain-containing protein n=1 Tax=Actinocorallia longicatena TaxID=111803 RepID=A0ABP6QFH5_9ACTN